MKKGMKVFSGLYSIALASDESHHAQHKAVVATTSQKKAAEIVGVSLRDIATYWSLTGNKDDIAIALARPETLMIKSGSGFGSGEWKSLMGWTVANAGHKAT